MLPLRSIFAVAVGTAWFLVPPAPPLQRLSALQSRGTGSAGVGSLVFSPDAGTVYYWADEVVDDRPNYQAAPSDGSAAPVASPLGRLFAFSPDGAWAVGSRPGALFSHPWPGGAPIRLADVEPATLQFSSDSARVVYSVVNLGTSFSVPVDGSAAPVPLHAPLAAGESSSACVLSPDATRVVYLLSDTTTQRLVSIPLAGGTPATIAFLPVGQERIESFAFTRDSARVVYTAGEWEYFFPYGAVFRRREIHSVASDGSSAPVQLNAGAPATSEVLFLDPLLATGGQVIYVSDQDPLAGAALFRVPADGSAAPSLLHASPDGSVDRAVLDPAGEKVVYVRRGASTEPTKLWVVPADGSGTPRELSSPSDPGQFVFQVDPLVSADGTRVAFISYPFPCSVPIDGSAPATLLTPGFAPTTRLSGGLRLTLDGARVVYLADQGTGGQYELYSVPIDGSLLPVRLNGPLAAADVSDLLVSRDGTRVAFLAGTPTTYEVYTAPIDGAQPAVQVSRIAPGPLAGEVEEFRVLGARAVYLADQDQNEQLELFSAPVDGSLAPVQLNGSMPGGGDVADWDLAEAAQRVVYLADQTVDNKRELYSRRLDGTGALQRLSGTLGNSRDVKDFALVPPGLAAVYRSDQSGWDELYLVPADGSAAPVKLNTTPVRGGLVQSYAVDAARVVYRSDQDVSREIELYSRPLDLSAPAVQLNRPLVAGGDVHDFALAPNGSQVVYRADARRDGVDELFSVPSDGSTPAVRLHAPLPAGLFVQDYVLSPRSDWVVFRADLTGLGTLELFRAPLDGSAPVERVHPALPSHADVLVGYRIDPPGTRIVFLVDVFEDEVQALFSVLLAGGRVRRLNEAPLAQGHVRFFQFEPSGARLVFAASVPSDDVALFQSPADGSAPAVRLSPPGTTVLRSNVLIQDGAVVYRTQDALAWVALTGGSTRELTPPAPAGELAWSLAPEPLAFADGRVVFLAGFEHWGLVELFSARLAPPVRMR